MIMKLEGKSWCVCVWGGGAQWGCTRLIKHNVIEYNLHVYHNIISRLVYTCIYMYTIVQPHPGGGGGHVARGIAPPPPPL